MPSVIRTVLPPARQRPEAMASAASANSAAVGWESASTNTSQSPVAAAAAALRARPIWLTGSNTTRAPAAAAIAGVASLELLSQTISSVVQPRAVKAACAAWMLASDAARPAASL